MWCSTAPRAAGLDAGEAAGAGRDVDKEDREGRATKLENRRAGTATAFVDSPSGERILQIGTDGEGLLFLAYRLYDASGALVAESEGFQQFREGLTILSKGGEVLLHVPGDHADHVRYRLYNSTGHLLTWSDGERTKIYPNLRMDGVGHGWARPD